MGDGMKINGEGWRKGQNNLSECESLQREGVKSGRQIGKGNEWEIGRTVIPLREGMRDEDKWKRGGEKGTMIG